MKPPSQKKKSHARSPENAQVTFSAPKDLVRKIRERAEAEGRSLSNWLQFHIGRELLSGDKSNDDQKP